MEGRLKPALIFLNGKKNMQSPLTPQIFNRGYGVPYLGLKEGTEMGDRYIDIRFNHEFSRYILVLWQKIKKIHFM